MVREHYQNGTAQTYGYDELGLSSQVDLYRPSGGAPLDLFSISIQRNAYGAPVLVTDNDQRGLNHSASYTYDAAGRLSDAAIGPAPGAGSPVPGPGDDRYAFTYRYDGLQNMIYRQVAGPKHIGVLTGVYRYGNSAHPRQLTSVTPGSPP